MNPKPTNKSSNWCKYHTEMPDGYLQGHDAAQTLLKTHRQVLCPGCGLYKIWVLKSYQIIFKLKRR